MFHRTLVDVQTAMLGDNELMEQQQSCVSF